MNGPASFSESEIFLPYEDSAATLAKHGKTFNWARRFLGKENGDKAAQLYAFCRYLDDLADDGLAQGHTRIEDMQKKLSGAVAPSGQMDEFARFLDFANINHLSLPALNELLEGLISDREPAELQSEADLLRYAYRVAGTVGVLMSSVLACYDEDAYAHAIDLGIAMQLTNIARDIAEDARMGRRYIPADWCADLSAAEICRAAADDSETEISHLVQLSLYRLLRLADKYYVSGFQGLPYLPARARTAIAVAGRAYQAIGHRMRSKNFYNWSTREVTGSGTKIISSFSALVDVRFRYTKKVKHSSELHKHLIGLPHVRSSHC